ncbi:MAG: hypothetical protein LIP10_14960 [Clostridiales bacterium]|nr:hypothetical protein [Clostridiales bacterium]
MATLTCDICGGQLSMDPSGEFAICESCGMKHTKDRVKAKVQEITGVVKIDDTDAVKEQISNWEKMAENAFNNNSYAEAYTYYCKILEKNVNHWLATYRKGLCLGWQGNLKNMHSAEVLGGIVDATKLLVADKTIPDIYKAQHTLQMAVELYGWINALNSSCIQHRDKFANQVVSAAYEFYQEMQVISTLLTFDIGMITEYVYDNAWDRDIINKYTGAVIMLGVPMVTNMKTTFRIKTGSKWNQTFNRYDAVFQEVSPDYKTISASNDLNNCINTFSHNATIWTANYKKKISDKKIADYWNEHMEEKQQYEDRIAEIDSELVEPMEKIKGYDKQITEIRKDLKQSLPVGEQISIKQKQRTDLVMQKAQLGLFAGKQKKQLQTQIDELQSEIDKLYLSEKEQKQKIQDDVNARVAVIEKERKPFADRVAALSSEKDQINHELTKER